MFDCAYGEEPSDSTSVERAKRLRETSDSTGVERAKRLRETSDSIRIERTGTPENAQKHIWTIGGKKLDGTVTLQGSKNAALPILAATLLIREKVLLHRVPRILDVQHMLEIFQLNGVLVTRKPSLTINAASLDYRVMPCDLVQAMRCSVLLVVPFLYWFHEICLPYPGGCIIGKRPIDWHLHALEQMGAQVEVRDADLLITTKGLRGAEIRLPFPSVGATETCILAGVIASGRTVIQNAAIEPEVQSLCHFLRLAGAKIKGIGTRHLEIEQSVLRGISYEIPGDRIVAGTYLLAALGLGGYCRIQGAPEGQLEALLRVAEQIAGPGDFRILQRGDSLELWSEGKLKGLYYLETAVHPGFPTDLQPILVAILSRASGGSLIKEKIFEGRFRYIEGLRALGGSYLQRKNEIFVVPNQHFYGAKVKAEDLRGGAALVIAGLLAEGKTEIQGLQYIKRGYENLPQDVIQLGGQIGEET